MYGVKFEFNDIKSLYTKNESERKRFVGKPRIFYICFTLSIIIITVTGKLN